MTKYAEKQLPWTINVQNFVLPFCIIFIVNNIIHYIRGDNLWPKEKDMLRLV